MIRLLNQSSKGAASKCLCVRSLPESGNWSGASLHGLLKVLILNALNEARGEHSLERAVDDWNTCEAELKHDVLIVFDEVLYCQEYCVEGIVHYVLSEQAGGCDRNRVAVDHAEAFLEYRILRFSRSDLLFSVIAIQVSLEGWVDYENWPDMNNLDKLRKRICNYCIKIWYQLSAILTYLILWTCFLSILYSSRPELAFIDLVAILGSSVSISNVKDPKPLTLTLRPALKLLFRYSIIDFQMIIIYKPVQGFGG